MWGEVSLIICSHCRLSSFQLTHSAWGLQSYLCRERTARGRRCQPPSGPNRGSWLLTPDESGEGASTCHHHLPLHLSHQHLNWLLFVSCFFISLFHLFFSSCRNVWSVIWSTELFRISSSFQLLSRNTKHRLDPSDAFPYLYSKLNIFGLLAEFTWIMENFDGLFIFSFLVLSPLKLIPGSSLKLQLGLHTLFFQANEHKHVLPQLLYRLI